MSSMRSLPDYNFAPFRYEGSAWLDPSRSKIAIARVREWPPSNSVKMWPGRNGKAKAPPRNCVKRGSSSLPICAQSRRAHIRDV
jgi:hypothetical protein